ncbi:MAG TPA: malto-oligosyltrehalose trehalohydrolase [Kofleriaceae bacterium]|nr:malto-oligosyltrehalose trehalohydrolase [Kofleriaceae bacterium]
MTDEVRVWAPRAARVDVLVRGHRIAGEREDNGWWRGPVLRPDEEYAFSLDGGPPRPDPRSRSQPQGVHGPSRWLGADALHAPTPTAFHPVPLRDAVIYELHVGTFSSEGTFASALAHLGHLARLGVTHVEILPVAQFSGVHGWGYDGVGLFAAHEGYGGPAGLRTLIEACHAHGLAVLIDVVHNHFGPEGAYALDFAPYRTAKHRTPWGDAINLDGEGAREVRRFLIDSALAWLRDFGADGLRLDALHALRDESALHFVAELTDAVRALGAALGRSFVLIGEYDEHDPRSVTERARGGWGLDAHWNDDFHHAIHALLTREHHGYYIDFAPPDTLARVLQGGYALDGRHSPFRGAPHGQPFGDLPRDRLVGYIQSHDQVGNRARGERLHQLCGLERTKLAAALLFTSPFVPMIFQGEEWAASTPFCYFAYPESEELREAIRRGRREEHGGDDWADAPDPTDPATREASVLRWDEIARAPHAEMLAWYRALIELRRTAPALRDPSPGATSVVERDGVIEVRRGDHALIANLGTALASCRGDVVLATRLTEGKLAPDGCAIVRR